MPSQKFFIPLLFVLLISSPVQSQPLYSTLLHFPYDNGPTQAVCISEVPAGGSIIVAQGTMGPSLFRLNNAGDTLWTKLLNHPLVRPRSINPIAAGGYLLAGDIDDFSSGSKPAFLMKLDSLGNELFFEGTIYGGVGSADASSLFETNDGHYAAVVWMDDPMCINPFTITIVDTSFQSYVWYFELSPNCNNNNPDCVKQLNDNSYIGIAQQLFDCYEPDPFYKTRMVKLSNNGSLLWEKYFEPGFNAFCSKASGGFIIYNKGNQFIKLNQNGDSLWTGTINAPFEFSLPLFVFETPDSNLLFIGTGENPGAGKDFLVYKTDSSGSGLWTRYIGYNCNDQLTYAEPLSDGTFLLSGTSHSTSTSDALIVKMDVNGNWNTTIPVVAEGPLTFCPGDSVLLRGPCISNVQWNTGATSAAIEAIAAGQYYFQGTIQIGPVISDTIPVSLFSLPASPVIVQLGQSLFSNYTQGNQWYVNGNLITGANFQNYTPLVNGTYSVQYTDSNGCSAFSAPYIFTTVGINNPSLDKLKIYPNPVNTEVFISVPKSNTEIILFSLYNALGNCIYSGSGQQLDETIFKLDLSGIAPGLYTLVLQKAAGSNSARFLKR